MVKVDPRTRFRLETAIFFVAALSFCSAANHWQWFRTFDYALYDNLVNAFSLPLNDDVVIVGIDEQSMAAFGRWPWSRQLQSELLDQIQLAAPKAVFLDFVYSGQSDLQGDVALVSAADSVEVLALPMIVDALATRRQLIEVLPYPDLLEVTDVIGHVHVELDVDATARGVYLYQGVGEARWPHLTLALADHLGQSKLEPPSCLEDPGFSLQNVRCDFVYFSFAGPPGTVPEVSARDLLSTPEAARHLKEKIVFVGVTTAAAPDSITSPVSGNDRPMSGVEFNVNLYNSIVQGRTISESSVWVLQFFALLCVVLPVLVLPRLKAKTMLLSAVLFSGLPIGVTLVSFILFNTHLPLASAVVTCFLSYPYWSWRRHEIAWQFVGAEMSRQEVEKSRWVFLRGVQSVDQELANLPALLESESAWHEEPPAFQRATQIGLQGPDGKWLVMSRSRPFTDKERAFAVRMAVHEADQSGEQNLPGEVLAAQIRRLQTAAAEVRLGREVGLRGLAEMPIGVAVVSALNRVLFVNQACRHLLDLPEDINRAELDALVNGLVPPLGTSWHEICRQVVIHGKPVNFETTTSATVPVVVEAAPLAEPGDVAESWVLTITDMTDVHIAERDREEALAFLSHDLRSPMLSIQALLRSGRDNSVLTEIERYTQKALSVSEQFLQLSRVQAREHFETYELDLVIVVANAVDFVYPTAREKHCEVRFSQPGSLEEGAWILGNGELLERAFVNLLTNAIKYSEPDSLIDVEFSISSDRFTVTVIDSGVGIPEDELEQVFLPYFRSAEPALAKRRGAGLGLRFVKTVVERHGGAVAIKSELGKGSQFSVTLFQQTVSA